VPADAGVTISGSYGGIEKTAALSVIATFSLTLDNGSGPIYTNQSTVGVRGHVAPGNIGPSVLVRGTLGAQNVTATPASDGAFTLPNLTLSSGSNAISVTGTAGTQSVGPVTATYVFDNVRPTSSVILSTNVPNPTNIPTWTLSGTVSPYLGPTENAFVYLNGGSTRFPIATDGTWSGSYTFVEGRNWIPFVVADLAGNYKNPPDYWDKYTFYLDTLGLRPVVVVGDYVPGGSLNFGWPAMLDLTFSRYVGFVTDSGASLNGSHLDVYFDEQGSFSGGSPVNCAPDNLTCLVERKPTPDISVDYPTSTEFTTPLWSVGIHTIRMVLRDPFGNVYERGALLPMAEHSAGYSYTGLPLANFGVPGAVTTQTPKLVGRMVDGVAPLDCNDNPGNRLPSFSYWDPKQGGSWKPLTASSSVVSGGVYEATPTSNIPITTLASGQKVLRIKLTEGVVKTNLYGNKYLEDTFGRNICNGQTVITSLMKPVISYFYPYAGSDAGLFYDLPYRSTAQGDNPAPQIDTSAAGPEIATDTSGPYSLTTRLRVTDLNGDLDYRNVTVATAGCGDSSCTFSTRLAGDQLLTSAQPGGYFTVQLPLVVGANNFVATARDDAGHVTNQSFTVNRTLTEVEAKITSPSSTGTYAFCSPKTVTFDASQSVNRTNPPVSLRYQWTNPSGGGLVSNLVTYTETLSSSGSRRVIVSSSAIPAPNPNASDPCAGISGKCSVATVTFAPFTVSSVPLPAQILAPLNDASVPADQPVTLDGTVGQSSDPSYVYKWRLQAPNGDYLTIPQSTGTGSDPSYAVENRTLTLRLDSIPGVVAGDYTLFFHAAHLTNPGSCNERETFSSIGITVTTKLYTATGLSPGAVVVGDGSTRLYGSGFDAAARIAISGPIYTLSDTTTPLCTMPACPQLVISATASADGTKLDFTTPAILSPAHYYVFASDPATGAASSAILLEVQPPQGTALPKTQTFDNIARPLTNGQTINGQFLAGRDTSGQHSDVDYYYFFAAAGSSVSLSLARTDPSLPWEAPDALDPELTLIDPDGLINQGSEAFDNQKGVDLNASLTNLVLAKSGRYFVFAATSKGFGPYQLGYSLVPSPPTSGHQVLPATNNDRTVRVDTPGLKPTALIFDPRGYQLSGAVIQYVATPEANETGSISFSPASSVVTTPRGLAQVNATLTAAGKISFEARVQAAGLIVQQEALSTMAAQPLPSYVPIGAVEADEEGLDLRTGEFRIKPGRIQHFEMEAGELAAAAHKSEEKGKPLRELAPGVARPGQPRVSSSNPTARPRGVSPQEITTCSPGQFRAAGVSNEDVHGPFTVKLTDLTPKTGQSGNPEEEIGVDGIHGHRVNKTIRIKMEIKDDSGLEPNYPVLVHLSLAGIAPGKIILDPDGARIECQKATFLWHERNAQGQIIALNDEFEYRLGIYAAFVGIEPETQNPGGVLPVWGIPEFLSVFFGTFDSTDGTFTNQYSAVHGVHPEPGAAHHFKWNPLSAPPMHRWEYLAAYSAHFGLDYTTFTNALAISNLYYLADQYDNTIYGDTVTTATDPASNVRMTFSAQGPGVTGVNPAGYRLMVEWNDNPTGANPKPSSQWPSGEYVSTLTISGTDPETGPFSISQAFTAVFSQPFFYSLVWVGGYDQPYDLQFDGSVTPPVPISFVAPGAPRILLNGELSRNSILLVSGTRMASTSLDPFWIGPPGSDPGVVDDGLDSFDVSLVDDKGELRSDAQIQVSFCPIFQKALLGPCPVANRVSIDGVIQGVRPIDRGYMGLLISKAPAAPGVYFFKITPLPSNTHSWRVGGVIDPQFSNYKYTYAVTVVSVEIVDEAYKPADPTIYVGEPRRYRVRYLAAPGEALPTSGDVQTNSDNGSPADAIIGLPLARLASSRFAFSDLFTVNPPSFAGSQAASIRPARASALEVAAGSGVGKLEALVTSQKSSRETQPVVVVELSVRDKDGLVPREVQTGSGVLICSNVDDDDLDSDPDFLKEAFPAGTQGALYIRERQDTFRVIVKKTARPSDSASLMLRGSITGESFINLYSFETGQFLQLPFAVPWDKITRADVSYIGETAGPKPLELTLAMDNWPQAAPDKGKFHGCDGSYFFISGAGHSEAPTYYIKGFSHAFQHQKLCGFADLNVSTGWAGDLDIIGTLFRNGLAGVATTDPAYIAVHQVLAATASARAAGKGVLVGYSYGATVTAAAAVEAAGEGSRFKACALIGPPVGRELLDSFIDSCDDPIIWDIPGDPIQSGRDGLDEAWEFLLVFSFLGDSSPHFYYAQDINSRELQARRDDLIEGWSSRPSLANSCPETQE
jgi:hypothetical protein